MPNNNANMPVEELTNARVEEVHATFNYHDYGYTSYGKDKSTKGEKKAKLKDPYSEIIQNEYLHILADSEKYGIHISDEIRNRLKKNIDNLNKIESDMKQLFEESSLKQEETKKALTEIKEEISEVLNAKKYEECIIKAEEFIKSKNYNNAKTCYENALYYTKSKRDEVNKKLIELKSYEKVEYISKWVVDIKYYIQAPNNTILNRVIETCYGIDFTLLSEDNIAILKTFYELLPNNKKVNILGAIIENKTALKFKLGLI